MSDSEELSEFEPYECLDDLAADLERYTRAQKNDDRRPVIQRCHSDFEREGRGNRFGSFGSSDEKDLRGKIAIQIRPKHSREGAIPVCKPEMKKIPFQVPTIEERLSKFSTGRSVGAPLSGKPQHVVNSPPLAHRSPPRVEGDIEIVELNRKQRFRLASDTFKTKRETEEVANSSERKLSLISDNLGLQVVGQSRSVAYKHRESSLSDHNRDDSGDARKENVKSISRRPKMQSSDGGEFQVRRKSSLGRKNASPAVDSQQKHSRFGVTEREEGGKQTQSWTEQRDDPEKINEQIRDRSKPLSHYGYKKPDLRLSSSTKVAAIINQSQAASQAQASSTTKQQLTSANTQLPPREKSRSVLGASHFTPQHQRSQSLGDPRNTGIRPTSSSLFTHRDSGKSTTDAAGKNPGKDLVNQSLSSSVGVYSSSSHKELKQQRAQTIIGQTFDEIRNNKSNSHSGYLSRKSTGSSVRDGANSEIAKISEQLNTDRSTHNLQKVIKPGVNYTSSQVHGNISSIASQNTAQSLVKSLSLSSRLRKSNSGFVESQKSRPNDVSERGKFVEKNNNTVWITDSGDSGSSEEDRTIETDSSTTCSLIDERRRRRLVKRTKKRSQSNRKSQISQILSREVSAIESQTSDDAASRASVDDSLTDVLSPEESQGKISSSESYKRARQIFETNKLEPQRAASNSGYTARKTELVEPNEIVPKYASIDEQNPPFAPEEDNAAMSTVHSSLTSFSNVSRESRNGRDPFKNPRKHSQGTFSAVAKVSKITIPSLQLKSFPAPNRNRHTSDTESYMGHSKMVADPFGLGRRSFRDNNLGFSDGEHELTARLEKSEEYYEEQAVDDQAMYDRRCYTLPRNIGRKKMKENPFQLTLPTKKSRELLSDSQFNSQSSLEDLIMSPTPFSPKDLSPNKIQSRSAGNIGVDQSMLQGDSSPLQLNRKFESSFGSPTNVVESPVFLEKENVACANDKPVFSPIEKSKEGGKTTPSSAKLSSPFFPLLIAPPDNFKDSPDEKVPEEELVIEKEVSTVESSNFPVTRPSSAPLVKSGIPNETSSPSIERRRGMHVSIPETKDLEKSHERDGSPRRRPSYLQAQFSESMFWTAAPSDKQNILSAQSRSEENMPMTEVRESHSEDVAPEVKETGEQKKKRGRPRIPATLGPLKSVFDDVEPAISPDKDASSPDKDVPDSSKQKDDSACVIKETIIGDKDLISALGEKKHEKSEIIKRRPRAILAATPMLEEIPEEKSHGSGSDTNNARIATDDSKNKGKKGRKTSNILQTVVAASDLESVEGRESPRTDRSEKAETGYFSGSLSSTPNQLSSLDDMMLAESPTFIDYQDNDAFKQDRVLDMFSNGKTTDAARSRSDPMPTSALTKEQPNLVPSVVSDVIESQWTSNSEPNLVSRNIASSPKPKRSISSQEVPVEVKEVVKDRIPSTESSGSLLSPVGSPFDQPVFSHNRTDSQKSFSSTSSVPASPVALASLPLPKAKQKPDMRRHVLQNLLDTENSYVQNLNFLVTVYYKPLKKSEGATIIETTQVDEIFFQIPEILVSHEFFLEQLNNRANSWTDKQIIGDIFVSSFTKCLLMDAYSSFINNFLQARATVRQASTRPPFAKFLEQCSKEQKEKLTLQDLMIQPVQRIPRYVLILKDMLKHTSQEHPDYGLLQLALEEIKTLAERMNKGEMEADQAEKEAEKLRDIEASIEGIKDLVTSSRKFIRQDLVAEIKGVITKKDRCLFLFSDLLVCATGRRKNNALRRGSLGLFSGQSATEFNRYKLLWKLPLNETELIKGGSSSTLKRATGDKQAERLEEDIAILGKISSMADTLLTPHQNLDMSIREIIAELNRQVSEQSQSPQPLQTSLARVELQAQTEDGTETFIFGFLSQIIKSSWEASYEDVKQKLAYARHSFPPEFQYPLPIDKTRSGMQFTCAAPSRLASIGDVVIEQTGGDIWVCNSDGYVGQVCLVSMIPEAQSRPCVTVCSARIQCISPVPGSKLISTNKPRNVDARKVTEIPEAKPHKKTSSKSSKGSSSSHSPMKTKKSFPSESEEDDQTAGPEAIMAFDSSDDEDADINSSFIGGPTVFGGRMSPDGSSLGTVESVEGLDDSSDNQSFHSGNETSDGEDADQTDNRRISMPVGTAVRRGNHGYTLKGSLDDLLSEDSDEQPTMWLGTEDGYIHVYQSSEVTQVRKSKMKIQLGAVVNAILYQDNKVFVALANGELCVYKRDPGNGWEVASPQTVRVGRNGSSISCIAAAAGRIWCGCQNNVILVNASTLKIESTIVVSQDVHRSVYRIVGSGLGVWISLQSSAVVRLYHATSFENLADIDVAPAVHKMLAGADAIIRQHKAACLRITALLACKDLLWIGTSAGVILTNPLPSIKVNTHSLRNAPLPTGSPHGHTGHVRFLTSVEVPKSQFRQKKTLVPQVTSNRVTTPLPVRTKVVDQVDHNVAASKMLTLVVSGGDGYEDFRTSAKSDSVGREDSTNHLLIWRV